MPHCPNAISYCPCCSLAERDRAAHLLSSQELPSHLASPPLCTACSLLRANQKSPPSHCSHPSENQQISPSSLCFTTKQGTIGLKKSESKNSSDTSGEQPINHESHSSPFLSLKDSEVLLKTLQLSLPTLFSQLS